MVIPQSKTKKVVVMFNKKFERITIKNNESIFKLLRQAEQLRKQANKYQNKKFWVLHEVRKQQKQIAIEQLKIREKMEHKNIKKTIGKFKEFNAEQQAEILNNYAYINVEFQDWNDYILTDFIDELKETTDLDIEAKDIIWAVGDRNSKFGVYSKNIINQLLNTFEDKGVYDIDTTEKLGSFLNHRGGGICEKGQTEFGLAQVYFEDEDITGKEQNDVKDEINNILDKIITLCSKYFNENYEAYNYNISDKSHNRNYWNETTTILISETLKIY